MNSSIIMFTHSFLNIVSAANIKSPILLALKYINVWHSHYIQLRHFAEGESRSPDRALASVGAELQAQ